jgi:tetratricopeptide (TPR) repeat protein
MKVIFSLSMFIYTLVIHVFEMALNKISQNETVLFDPLLKVKYYMQLGHCYRKLKLYIKALENYNLTFEQNICLSPDEYIETLIGTGKALEAINKYEDSLYKYIEVAEISQANLTEDDIEQRYNLQDSVKRTISHLIYTD